MRLKLLALALGSIIAWPLHAQQAAPQPAVADPAVAVQQAVPNDGIRTESTVVVTGEQPGPGLWLVRNGSHDLWILGTLNPLPSGMQWQSAQVEQVIANAQEVIRPPRVSLDVEAGFFGKLMLVPSMLGARKNPDGKRLQEIVSPASYVRWKALKARYIGNDGGVEKWRPLFAAQELYQEAMKKSGLDSAKSVWPVINKAIETHHPNVTVVKEEIVVKDPKPLLKEWSKTTLDDIACFDNTMTRIETDLDAMRARANAWATGDMAALQSLPPPYQWEECNNAITEAGIGKRLGFGDANQRVRTKWLAAADAALNRNAVTFATLDMRDLLGANGFLAKLKAKGYTVLAPDE
ncbi:MAG TPA: TraB/GumN family protein [Thermomonas sp.]|nr:TraB/GumN family protein [Thermomonas sp.]